MLVRDSAAPTETDMCEPSPRPACAMPGAPFRRRTRMAAGPKSYVTQEASLDDLLAEPIVRALMRRDGVTDADVREAVGRTALLRRLPAPRWA
jgi:hypothetical protein